MRATIPVIWELGPQLCSRALSLPQETKGTLGQLASLSA